MHLPLLTLQEQPEPTSVGRRILNDNLHVEFRLMGGKYFQSDHHRWKVWLTLLGQVTQEPGKVLEKHVTIFEGTAHSDEDVFFLYLMHQSREEINEVLQAWSAGRYTPDASVTERLLQKHLLLVQMTLGSEWGRFADASPLLQLP